MLGTRWRATTRLCQAEVAIPLVAVAVVKYHLLSPMMATHLAAPTSVLRILPRLPQAQPLLTRLILLGTAGLNTRQISLPPLMQIPCIPILLNLAKTFTLQRQTMATLTLGLARGHDALLQRVLPRAPPLALRQVTTIRNLKWFSNDRHLSLSLHMD